MSELVSVIITTCNGTRKLVRAIESVLNQTYKDIEVLVVDDNGRNTPGQIQTEEMLSDYIKTEKIKYITHDVNKNGAAARNTGVRNAVGTYLAFLDDDDFYFPERIAKMLAVASEKKADMIYSDVLFIRGKNMVSIMKAKAEGFSYKDLLVNQGLLGTGSNVFIKREIYDKINGFDETFFRYQDVEFMIRALKVGKIVGVNQLLVAKDITDVRFYPRYDKFALAQEMFFEKFERELNNNLDNEKKREAIYTKRVELYYSACMSGNKVNIENALVLLKQDIPNMTDKEILRVRLRGVYLQKFYPFLALLRRQIQIIKTKKLEQTCSADFLKNYSMLINAEILSGK